MKRTRYIAAAVRRELWARDRGRCAYVDAEGRRCAETARLEIHQRFPHGKGGERDAENLELRCRREHMAWKRGALTARAPRWRGPSHDASDGHHSQQCSGFFGG